MTVWRKGTGLMPDVGIPTWPAAAGWQCARRAGPLWTGDAVCRTREAAASWCHIDAGRPDVFHFQEGGGDGE